MIASHESRSWDVFRFWNVTSAARSELRKRFGNEQPRDGHKNYFKKNSFPFLHDRRSGPCARRRAAVIKYHISILTLIVIMRSPLKTSFVEHAHEQMKNNQIKL